VTNDWKTKRNMTGLIDLFETIPQSEYNGDSIVACLIGYPISYGVLKAEYAEYAKACFDTGDDALDAIDWLAKRYRISPERLEQVYYGVAEHNLRHDLPKSIRFARQFLRGRTFDRHKVIEKVVSQS
jgi:hypothetical protein